VVELADIFRRAGQAYSDAFQGRIPPSHLRAMWDITRCRTPALGGSLYACDHCDSLDYSYHSCRNRHCPKCQDDRAQAWLQRLRARLLPCDHYLLTFTLPAELRPLARSHQRLVYGILLREAAAAVQLLANDPQWVGGRPAILAVLHTWSRTLTYHPHVHLLVSAGGLSPDGSAWVKPAHPRFLFPGYALSPIFRAKVREALRRAGLHQDTDPSVWGAPADVVGRYRRRTEDVDDLITEAYVQGVSTRGMGAVTEALMGEQVSRSTVSRTAKKLDEAVTELREQPIGGSHPYLYLDATYLDARWARKVENVSALVAYAVGPEGKRRLLGITIGPEESEDSWAELLIQLLERGLTGVRLVIADEHAGLAAAVRRFLPEAERQRCRQTRRMTLPVLDFMARFLQHVLPTGFAKIRSYGLLSPSCRQGLQRARHLLESAAAQVPQRPARANGPADPPPAASTEPTPRLCPVCKRGHLSLQRHDPQGQATSMTHGASGPPVQAPIPCGPASRRTAQPGCAPAAKLAGSPPRLGQPRASRHALYLAISPIPTSPPWTHAAIRS
jgi:putative transposase